MNDENKNIEGEDSQRQMLIQEDLQKSHRSQNVGLHQSNKNNLNIFKINNKKAQQYQTHQIVKKDITIEGFNERVTGDVLVNLINPNNHTHPILPISNASQKITLSFAEEGGASQEQSSDAIKALRIEDLRKMRPEGTIHNEEQRQNYFENFNKGIELEQLNLITDVRNYKSWQVQNHSNDSKIQYSNYEKEMKPKYVSNQEFPTRNSNIRQKVKDFINDEQFLQQKQLDQVSKKEGSRGDFVAHDDIQIASFDEDLADVRDSEEIFTKVDVKQEAGATKKLLYGSRSEPNTALNFKSSFVHKIDADGKKI